MEMMLALGAGIASVINTDLQSSFPTARKPDLYNT